MRIILYPMERRVSVGKCKNLLEALQHANISLDAVCGGRGLCGRCRVRLVGEEGEVTNASQKHLARGDIEDGVRLACQVSPHENMRVEIPQESLLQTQKILVYGMRHTILLKSNIQKYHFILDSPTLHDTRSDLTRILDALGKVKIDEIELDALRRLPYVLREYDFSITVVIAGKRIVGFEAGDTVRKKYGIAVDIGTTSVVGYLMDLNTGTQIAASALMNPQMAHGEDVVSRIQYAMSDEGLNVLHSEIVDGLRHIIEDLCRKSDVEEKNIYEIIVAGNTAMLHLFLGISPASLINAPYVSSIKSGVVIHNFSLPSQTLLTLPVISGFVGADTVGCLLASRFDSHPRLLLDIGTNCEIVMGTREKILACSAAAGPAFEGAHIKNGMRASTGAITEVFIEDDISLTTIDDAPPGGIAGSGLVSAASAMLEEGIINKMGRILYNNKFKGRVRGKGGNTEFILVRGGGTQKEITITQKDIRELQLAKGAIFAAQRILSHEYRVALGDIDRLELAGAFGTFIPKVAAQTIGMLPDIPLRRIQNLGNAAGTGAQMVLLSIDERKKAEGISQKVIYVELSARKEFEREFIDAMIFPHANTKLFPNVIKRLSLNP
jgi:uncharacterized 2Fe-2S/4Fe-4S cluster protein (DUF4445 family)